MIENKFSQNPTKLALNVQDYNKLHVPNDFGKKCIGAD